MPQLILEVKWLTFDLYEFSPVQPACQLPYFICSVFYNLHQIQMVTNTHFGSLAKIDLSDIL